MSAKIIYDSKREIPESLLAEAKEIEDGKWELDAKGVLDKNSQLLGKVTAANTVNQRLTDEIEGLKTQVISPDKVAVAKSEYDAIKAENEQFKTLGAFTEIKPKVEGYETMKAQTKQAVKDKALLASGVKDLDRARRFKSYDELEIESEIKDGKEIFHRITTDEKGKETKNIFSFEALQSDVFKDDLGSLLEAVGSDTKTRRFAAQTPTAAGNQAVNKFDRIRESKQAEQRPAAASASVADRFYNRNLAGAAAGGE